MAVHLALYLAGTLMLLLFVDALAVPRAPAPLAMIVLSLPLTYLLPRYVIRTEVARPNLRRTEKRR